MAFSTIIRPVQQLAAAATALLVLAACERQALTAGSSNPPPSHYYLNGQPSTKQEVDALPASTIDRMDVLTGQQARTYTRDSAATGVVLVKTK